MIRLETAATPAMIQFFLASLCQCQYRLISSCSRNYPPQTVTLSDCHTAGCDEYSYSYSYLRIPAQIFVLVFVFALFCQLKHICIYIHPFFKPNIFVLVFAFLCQPKKNCIIFCHKNSKLNIYLFFTIINQAH